MDISGFIDAQKDGAEFAGRCHDCGREVIVFSEKSDESRVRIKGGALYEACEGIFFKCEECFSMKKTLKNHQKCEVYSRIVGYLRPISQWNKGKLSEYGRRRMLKV